jgi:cell wall-associated NlpC family hydrolase
MSVGISGVEAVLARISQIQASFSPPAAKVAATSGTTSAGTATSGSAAGSGSVSDAFATTLAGAQATPGGAPSVTGDAIVASAKKYLGVPYVLGGTTSTGIDCSGLVQRAYSDLGISVPRLSWDQAKAGTAVPNMAQAQPGDILGFGQPAEHVAIYLGNNMMIAAPQPGESVKIQSVYETPASIRRIVSNPSSGLDGLSGAQAAGFSRPMSVGSVSQYSSLFAQAETQYQLPQGLLAAVAQTESDGNASAVSPAGAQGLMQLMPSTAAGLGVDPWDPSQAVRGAAQLLSKYVHNYGSVPLALAAYNAGPGAVEQYGGVPPYRETQNYVAKITGLMKGGHI